MRMIYCIAFEDASCGGVNWYDTKETRDAAVGKHGFKEEIPFSFDLDEETHEPNPTADQITDIADAIYWERDYKPDQL